MSARDKSFVKAVGVPVAQVADAINKTRQAVNRGIHSDNDYFKPADLARALNTWKRDPGLRQLAREAISTLYPEVTDAVLRAAEVAGASEFSEEVPGEYWFVCGDLVEFRTSLTVCARQLEALADLRRAQLLLFVNRIDIALAKRFGERFEGVEAIRCDSDLSLVPSTLLRIDVDDNIDVFGATEAGFLPLSRSEATRLRRAIHSQLLPDRAEEVA